MSSSGRSTVRRNKIVAGIAGLFLWLCLGYAAGLGAYHLWRAQSAQPSVEAVEPFAVFREVWQYVDQNFYGDLPPARTRTYGAIRESLTLLDDTYTIFVEPIPRRIERERMQGSFGGIGVTVQRSEAGHVTLAPYPASPAEKGGIRDGDILLAVDGQAITGEMTLDDIRARIRGVIGSTVTLTISHSPTPPFVVTITREEVLVPSVTWRLLERHTDTGYIRIECFTERTGDEIIAALQNLRAAGATSLVLDLRDNPGGLIDSAVATASQFLVEGIILYEQGRGGQVRTVRIQSGGVAVAMPLAVLINGGTASAAEIVAGALQDHERGPLIGETTFGKGSVQSIFDLSDGSSLHVTTALWLTPRHRQIEGQGLTPDLGVSDRDASPDEQLERAVAYLRSADPSQR